MTTHHDTQRSERAGARRIKLKALIVQMNEANNGLTGMALLARDPKNLNKYIMKFTQAYDAAMDLLDSEAP